MPARDFRNARTNLRLSLAELARLADVSVPLIQRLEDDASVVTVRASNVAKVRKALQDAGADFGADGVYREPSTAAGADADPFAISARRFRRARIRTGLEPRDLLQLTGLSYPTLRAVERGEGPPRVARETVVKVVEAYRTVGYRFCVDPDRDHLIRSKLEAWRNAA